MGIQVTPLQGGSASSPVLVSGASVTQVSGNIGAFGSQDYYSFFWSGGPFSASAMIAGAPAGASYLSSAGVTGSCNGLATVTLDGTDAFSGTISLPGLAAGQYCIGLDANNPNDPAFSLTFSTPVSGVPEPATFVLLPAGLAILGTLRRAARCA